MKVSEMLPPALDWAVAKCEGRGLHRSKSGRWMTANYGGFNPRHGAPWYEPSTDWAQGGPIIERERITVDGNAIFNQWMAVIYVPNEEPWEMRGPTPLIAAMRCYVASRLGDEIEIPEELKGE
jgi:hypothetical protein